MVMSAAPDLGPAPLAIRPRRILIDADTYPREVAR